MKPFVTYFGNGIQQQFIGKMGSAPGFIQEI